MILCFAIFLTQSVVFSANEGKTFEEIGMELAKASLERNNTKMDDLGNAMSNQGGKPKSIKEINLNFFTSDEEKELLKDIDTNKKRKCAVVFYELNKLEYKAIYCK